MSRPAVVAAVDLGAESGRVMTVGLDNDTVSTTMVHRFGTSVLRRHGALRWDFDRLVAEVRHGLKLLGSSHVVASAGVDTWGLDYGLLDASGSLLDLPISHRDGRTSAVFDRVLRTVGSAPLYRATGIQLLEVNSIFQWLDDNARPDRRLQRADRLLMMPDLFHHTLGGDCVTEYTAATTTGAYDVRAAGWATGLLGKLGLPTDLLPEVVAPGTDLGALTAEPGDPSGLSGTRIVAPAAHDTASAVVAVPFTSPDAVFVSSGTWSLVGVERDRPLVTDAAKAKNLSNEGGYGGRIRLLRNVMGLWLLQCCRRVWREQGLDLDYADLVQQAAGEPPGRSIVDPDHREFLVPGDMPARIRAYCARTGQPVPMTPPAVTRCVLDSLALGYDEVVGDLGRVIGTRPPAIHIVGGGSRNSLLSQTTADITGLPVYCGPVEATALGNGLVQWAALGAVAGLDEMRELVRAGSTIHTYEPRDPSRWDAARELFGRLRSRSVQNAVPTVV
jgi:rhamnulokinase